MSRSTKRAKIASAEKFVLRAAVGCIDKTGHSFRIATESMARTFFINEHAFQRLERAVARLRDARRGR